MNINLIPASGHGISYGTDLMTTAIRRFRKQLLAVIVVCPEGEFEYKGGEARPDNITHAQITAAIVLLREPGTIGQVTGFILEEGININLSGTGGAYGQEFMDCLVENDIQPWFYPTASVIEHLAERSGQPQLHDFFQLPLYMRLNYWKQFLIDEIAPQLYTEAMSIFGGKRTGTWEDSWEADDI